jgi:hypothetical protein
MTEKPNNNVEKPTARSYATEELRRKLVVSQRAIINMNAPDYKKQHPEPVVKITPEPKQQNVYEKLKRQGFSFELIMAYANAADEHSAADLLNKNPGDYDLHVLQQMAEFRREQAAASNTFGNSWRRRSW